MGNHSAGRHSRHTSNGPASAHGRDARQASAPYPRHLPPGEAASYPQPPSSGRGGQVRPTIPTARASVRPTEPIPTATTAWGVRRLGQAGGMDAVGMDTVTGPISDSTTARVRREDASRQTARAGTGRGSPGPAVSVSGSSSVATRGTSRSGTTRNGTTRGGAAPSAGVRESGRGGGTHRAGPARGSARTKLAVASTASIAGLSALVTGVTLSSPPGDANNGSGGPSVEAASIPSGFSAGNGQASRSDRGGEPMVTPQVPADPSSSYDDGAQPLPGPAYGDDDTYGGYVPPSGDLVSEPIPVFPLPESTDPQSTQPFGDQPHTGGTTTAPGTQPRTPPPPMPPPPGTWTGTPPPPPPPPASQPPPPPASQPPVPPPPPPEVLPPSPTGTALPFDPEIDSMGVSVTSLRPNGNGNGNSRRP